MSEAANHDRASHDRLFVQVLNDTIDRLESLLRTLDGERQALTGQDPDALQAAVRRKLEALAEVEQMVIGRDRLQAAAGLPPGLEGGARFVAARTPELGADWQRMLQLCRRVEQGNAANGQLALQSARQAREALSILTGRDQTPALYGRGKRDQQAAVSGYSFGRV